VASQVPILTGNGSQGVQHGSSRRKPDDSAGAKLAGRGQFADEHRSRRLPFGEPELRPPPKLSRFRPANVSVSVDERASASRRFAREIWVFVAFAAEAIALHAVSAEPHWARRARARLVLRSVRP
jgi:hypothetical protein